MNQPSFLSLYRHALHRGTHGLRAIPWSLLRILGAFSLLLLLSGCAASVGLTAKERAAIHSGDRVLVLVRVQCTVDDRPLECGLSLPSLSGRRLIGFALGSFDTFGEPRYVDIRALSDESFDAGWAFLLLSPGYHYLYVQGLDSSAGYQRDYSKYRDAPRWQIAVPERAKWIYAGTLTLAGEEAGTLMFGDKIIVPVKNQDVPLSDDRESAGRLLKGQFPDAGEVRTILMKRWQHGDPFIFRSPWLDPPKQP